MYQAVLTRRYLTSKIMPVLAMLAVTLSVGTVLVTWSVMGGFLNTLLRTGRTLIGDVAILWPNTGFAHYDDLVERLEADERVAAAAPIIETFGLVSFPDDLVRFAQLKGVDPDSFDRVTRSEDGAGGFAGSLWWRPLDRPTRKDHEGVDVRLERDGGYAAEDGLRGWGWDLLLAEGLRLRESDGSPAVAPGIAMSGWNQRTREGIYSPRLPRKALADGGVADIRAFLPHTTVALHVLPLDSGGRPRAEVVTRTAPVANEFFTGMYEVDSQTVLVNLALLQSMLDLDEARRVAPLDGTGMAVDPATGELTMAARQVVTTDPARVTSVLVRAASPTRTPEQAAAFRGVVEDVYGRFWTAHAGSVPAPESIIIRTWRDLNATTIAAVEKETGLVLFVFGLVCFTTVFLVLAIFWSMVSEKTRDIGILRALGAGTAGVAWLWLRYGAVIGVVGSGFGAVGAWLVIRNVNEIHDWMGRAFDLVIWDPAIYSFVEIPTDMDWVKTAVVVGAGVMTCLLGAAVPALRAGRMDPVRALRFE